VNLCGRGWRWWWGVELPLLWKCIWELFNLMRTLNVEILCHMQVQVYIIVASSNRVKHMNWIGNENIEKVEWDLKSYTVDAYEDFWWVWKSHGGVAVGRTWRNGPRSISNFFCIHSLCSLFSLLLWIFENIICYIFFSIFYFSELKKHFFKKKNNKIRTSCLTSKARVDVHTHWIYKGVTLFMWMISRTRNEIIW